MFSISYVILFTLFLATKSSRVVDLTDEFPDRRTNDAGYWLIKFYAPWCGHCKHLEPIWSQVARALSNRNNIKVARLDCNRFPSLAAEFGIRGYPTIKFVTANSEYTYNGERNKEDIVKFAIKMAAPPVTTLTHPESFVAIKNVNKLFFVYVGHQNDSLWLAFQQIATKLQPHAHFFCMDVNVARETMENVVEAPSIFVYKDGSSYFFPVYNSTEEENLINLNASLFNWINQERFELYPKVTRTTINEITQTNKFIVLVIVAEDKFQKIPMEMLEFRNRVEDLVRKNRSKYHRHFQFGWIGSPELANSIAMQILPLPNLLVLNSSNHQYYLPVFSDDSDDRCLKMTQEDIEVFLEMVYNQTVPAFGGDGFAVRLYRVYFDASTTLIDMWRSNPTLTTVLFGLPLTFFSFIFYSACCTDILETDEEEHEEEEEEAHIKKD